MSSDYDSIAVDTLKPLFQRGMPTPTSTHFYPEVNCLLHGLHSMISSNLMFNQLDETQFINPVCLASSIQCHQTFQVQVSRVLQDATLLGWCKENGGTLHLMCHKCSLCRFGFFSGGQSLELEECKPFL